MGLTRREFLAAGAAAASAAALGSPADALAPAGRLRDAPNYLVGDPYRSAIEAPGLGGRSFESARQRALLWRAPAAERDRLYLGLEIPRA